MTGINQGRPEAAVGEPIRFGDDLDFEIEQHPISDRLIIRDTANGTVAYVRAEDSGQIGGDGVLIKALKESKPMADTGRVYDSIQAAERAASSWVFVPPGTYNESVEITTKGLTLRGSGYNTHISTSTGPAIQYNVENVTISNISVSTLGTSNGINGSDKTVWSNVSIREAGGNGGGVGENSIVNNLSTNSTNGTGVFIKKDSVISNSIIKNAQDGVAALYSTGDNVIVSNNIVVDAFDRGIRVFDSDGNIIVGNRVINSDGDGIETSGGASNTIIANNRVSGSSTDIDDSGTNGLLDGNLTGASN
jgi:parallel beta-helix repeat protein